MSNSFFHTLKNKYHIDLNNQQKKAILHKDGPALVLAVPGAGKTTSLICRTANLIIHHKIRPAHILSVTFSRASALDMKKRFYSIFGKAVRENVYFSTIHRLALSILTRYAKKHGFVYTIIEGNNSNVNKNILLKNIFHSFTKNYMTEEQLEDLSSSISFVKNNMIHPKDFHLHDLNIEFFPEIYMQYEEYKKNNNFIDFDDMLSISFDILKNNPKLLQQYRMHYPYIQVDEAQDTSILQHAIINLLASPNNNLFMVADDDQSIYGFRGASPGTLLDFSNIYKNADIFFLEQNYRSSKEIVTISNAFITSNQQRYTKNMFTDNKFNLPIDVVSVKDIIDQSNYIIDEISMYSDEKISVLYRNNISSLPLIDALNRNNIPFYLQGFNFSFFNHWLLKDILAFLDVSLNPYDLDSFERIYYKMNAYISKSAIHHMKNHPKSVSVFDYLIYSMDMKDFQKKNLKRFQKDFASLAHMNPTEALTFIAENLNYRNYLKTNAERLKYSYDHIIFIFTILKSIASKTTSIIDFMERLKELPSVIKDARNTDKHTSILLSTVHSSKGLEFDRVYLIDLVEGKFPTKPNTDPHDEELTDYLEEERRLFYVGMTRAKKSLNLVVPNFQDGAYIKPSIFVKEVNAFIREYFPPMKKKQRIFTKSFSSKKINPTFHPLTMGDLVEHEKFGEGIVQSIDQDIIYIDFYSVGVRGLSLNICFEKHILKIKN